MKFEHKPGHKELRVEGRPLTTTTDPWAQPLPLTLKLANGPLSHLIDCRQIHVMNSVKLDPLKNEEIFPPTSLAVFMDNFKFSMTQTAYLVGPL